MCVCLCPLLFSSAFNFSHFGFCCPCMFFPLTWTLSSIWSVIYIPLENFNIQGIFGKFNGARKIGNSYILCPMSVAIRYCLFRWASSFASTLFRILHLDGLFRHFLCSLSLPHLINRVWPIINVSISMTSITSAEWALFIFFGCSVCFSLFVSRNCSCRNYLKRR